MLMMRQQQFWVDHAYPGKATDALNDMTVHKGCAAADIWGGLCLTLQGGKMRPYFPWVLILPIVHG